MEARLIKALEKKGFFLEFPDYDSSEEIITGILKEKNERIKLALPLFLSESFDYRNIIKKLGREERRELDKIILISRKIFEREKIKNRLKEIIKKEKIKGKVSKSEFNYYYDSFKESFKRYRKEESSSIEGQLKLRLNLDLNKSLEVLFSPAKIRIMKKIFNHEKLTNTELKYYYKAISNINRAVLNPSLQEYLRLIETSRKELYS